MNNQKNKRRLLRELEDDVRRIAKNINDTRGGCPSHKIGKARELLIAVLKFNLKTSITERMKLLIGALQKTAIALDETRRDFHSRKLKSVREDISSILKKYEFQIK